MRLHVLTAASAAAALALAVPTLAAAGSTSASPAAASSTVTTDRSVRLITGDVALVRSTGARTSVVIRTAAQQGIGAQYTTVRLPGHTFVIPGAARRYVDTILSRSLFDVTTLAHAAPTTSIPVTVAITPGTTASVPGLTVTSRSATSESGYLTPDGARTFGAALARQATADGRAGRVPTSIFGGVRRIAAPGATPVPPSFQQYTLQVRVLTAAGKPASFAFVALTNVDNAAKFTNFIAVIDGLAKVSVPAGTYSGLGEVDEFDTASPRVNSALIPVEQFSLVRNNQTMVFDARTATVVPAVRTPRAAGLITESFEWDRFSHDGGVSSSTGVGPGSTVHVAPSAPATKGQLEWITSWSLSGQPRSGSPYTYDLSFHDSGQVPADQTHTVAAGQLAELDSRYYTDAQLRSAAFGRSATYPFQFFTFTQLLPMGTPLVRVEYVYAPADATWLSFLLAAPSFEDPFQGIVGDGYRIYRAGGRQGVGWLRGPLAPGIAAQTDGDPFHFCSDCRDDRTLVVGFAPYVDTTPGHAGSFDLLSPTMKAARFRLYRDGTLIDDQVNATGDQVRVSAARATYRAVASTTRGLVGFATSTSATEDVTFVSAAGQGPTPPRSWSCPGAAACTVLPLLAASVPLPTDLAGFMPIGASRMTFTVGHVQHAADPAISGVRFETTSDGGATYRSLPVTALGGGRYGVTFTNPSSQAGLGIGIRVSAHDAAGGRLVETVQNAYYVAQT